MGTPRRDPAWISDPKFELGPEERATLDALCDVFIAPLSDRETSMLVTRAPPGVNSRDIEQYCRVAGSQMGVTATIEEALRVHGPVDKAEELRFCLKLFGSRGAMALLCGTPNALTSLTPHQREAALLRLKHSPFLTKRKIFNTLQKLIVVKAFTATADRALGPAANPMWPAVGYQGPPPASEADVETAQAGRDEHVYRMLNDEISGDAELAADAVVVGSGCGGAVVAARLASVGLRVIVVDKGPYLRREDMTAYEEDAFKHIYDRGSLITTENAHIGILAGSAFGGGTAVNWSCSLRTPHTVRAEWAREHGLPLFLSDRYRHALDSVCDRLGVQEDVAHNRNNELLVKGCKACGYPVKNAPQNMADVSPNAPGAAFIPFGDKYGIKRSTPETYLRDAATAATPAQFLERCRVERVIHEKGRTVGVVGTVTGKDNAVHRLVIRAPTVVVACGSLHSPALLLRSRVPDRSGMIGKNLRLHPVTGVHGIVPNSDPDCNGWTAAPMTVLSEAVAGGRDGSGYGALLECPSMHIGIAAATAPWLTGRKFKEAMLWARRSQSIIVLCRDRGSGEVKIDKAGEPRVYYSLDQHDEQSMLDGLEAGLRIAEACGATGIRAGGTALELEDGFGFTELPDKTKPEARQKALESAIKSVRSFGLPNQKSSLFSAHQMGTCRMGSSSVASVVNPHGQLWGVNGLFVADASVFPTSSGVNPMVTTLSIATMIADSIVEQVRPGTASHGHPSAARL